MARICPIWLAGRKSPYPSVVNVMVEKYIASKSETGGNDSVGA